MTKLVAWLLLPFSLASLWQRATRATNSHAATARGVKAYTARQYDKAETAFAVANAARPSSATGFNLGTAQIATGKYEDGSAALASALRDQKLREPALYNRGNGALAANAFDSAIRDYSEALRISPGDLAAKRNLEIALARSRQQQQSRSGQQKNAAGGQKNEKPQPGPGAGKNDQRNGQQSSESLLRAVQEQEQEELNRMKRAHAQRGRIGW